MPSLLLGAGNSRAKKVALQSAPNWTGELVTLDMNPNCGASVVWDLDNHPLPFPDEHFDELAAYDVLEHMGRQGDWRGWFNEMAEYHRLLKPGGHFGIIVPIGSDAFADPGHTRFFSGNYFTMLSQKFYQDQIDADMPVTDYRWFWKKNFNIVFMEQVGNHHLAAMLERA
jgi:SAM-dependent methyltransferase